MNRTPPRSKPRVAPPAIPGYRFLYDIAVSAGAQIHLAYSEELGHNVAIKLVPLGHSGAQGPTDADRFERERDLMMRIRHPGVVDIYDWGDHAGFRYIATEYFPAGSLELRLRNLLSTHDVFDIFFQTAGALRAVHGAGLAHRDLKPANVMLRANGEIVLIDFGLAKSVTEDAHLTNPGEIRGSPFYISPEQALGYHVDQRSDLYSLGVILYEMLVGARPFVGKSVVSILAAHQNDPIPQLPERIARFQSLVDGLLAKDPQQRIPTADKALEIMAKIKA